MLKINCFMHETHLQGYTCSIFDQDVHRTSDYKLIGKHDGNKKNKDVKIIVFNNCKIIGLPVDLKKHFPRFDTISIMFSTVHYLDKNDLDVYTNLRAISFVRNAINFLPGNLIDDLPNLKFFEFRNNGKTPVGLAIVDKLRKLDTVFYKKLFYHKGKPKSEAHFERIRQWISDDCEKSPWKKILQDKEKVEQTQTSDFEITIDRKIFKARKGVLAAQSPYFAKVFEIHPDLDAVRLTDITPKTFAHILNFMNTGSISAANDVDFEELLEASEKLKMKALANFAATNLEDKINVLNALRLLQLSDRYGHVELKQKCCESIVGACRGVDDFVNSSNKLGISD